MRFDAESAKREAERAVRRGELREAVALYERVVAADPRDEKARGRLASVRNLLDPHDAAGAAQDKPPAVGSTPEEEGERLAATGRYGEAAALYAQALESKPDSALLMERYKELLSLSRESQPPPKTAREQRDASRPDPPPGSREDALRSLLEAVGRNRR